MALIHSEETPHGVIASYWRITHVAINWQTRHADLTVSGYRDREARVANKQPLVTRPLAVGEPEFSHYFRPDGRTLSDAYACLCGIETTWLTHARSDHDERAFAAQTGILDHAERFRRSHTL